MVLLSMASDFMVSVTCNQPQSTNIKWKIPTIKRFINFKLYVILSSIMKSHVVPLHPAQDVDHHFVQSLHTVNVPCLLATQ